MNRTVTLASGSRLATVWTIVESLGRSSTLIVVASATALESTSPVARGLCEASHEAGNRTAYLYLGSGTIPPIKGTIGYDDLLLPEGGSPRQAFDGLLPAWRSEYDVLIIDVPEFNEAPLGAHIARIADGVVIALFSGRRITSADHDLKTLLSQLGTSIVGIVNTTKRESDPGIIQEPKAWMHSWTMPARQR